MLEYEEVLTQKYTFAVATSFLVALRELPNIFYAHVYYRWNLIPNDPDDNKFVDCYIAAGAQYLLSHDTHFSVLKNLPFPKVNLVNLDEFHSCIPA